MHVYIAPPNPIENQDREERVRIELVSHSGTYWRYCNHKYSIDSVSPPLSSRGGRYHRAGTSFWYGASCATGAWSELIRYSSPEIPIQEYKGYWNFGSVTFNALQAIDLTDKDTLNILGVMQRELRANYRHNDRTLTIADLIWKEEDVDAIIAPQAPIKGHKIIAVRERTMHSRKCCHVSFEKQSPPLHLEELRLDISPI